MKKIFLTIAITMGMAFVATAQRDGFFNDWKDFQNREKAMELTPTLPNGGQIGDQDAPLGTGLLILTALGTGYAFFKRREERGERKE